MDWSGILLTTGGSFTGVSVKVAASSEKAICRIGGLKCNCFRTVPVDIGYTDNGGMGTGIDIHRKRRIAGGIPGQLVICIIGITDIIIKIYRLKGCTFSKQSDQEYRSQREPHSLIP